MKIVISENQYNKIIINEAKTSYRDLCNNYPAYTKFCKKVEEELKNPKKGGVTRNLFNLSKDFFNKVIRDDRYFNKVELKPPHPEFTERIEQLEHLLTILKRYNSCPDIIDSIENDINVLPEKGLSMVIDEDGKYSLLNRLDTHYSAKAYLLTELVLSHYHKYDEQGNWVQVKPAEWNSKSNDEVREIIYEVLKDENVGKVAEILDNLIKTTPSFREYFFGSLQYSRESGNKVESEVVEKLKQKYGRNNVIEFSGDYDFVDYFGIDAILIHNEHAHPIQISSKVKNPKIFKFASTNCQPIGYYLSNKKLYKYYPEV